MRSSSRRRQHLHCVHNCSLPSRRANTLRYVFHSRGSTRRPTKSVLVHLGIRICCCSHFVRHVYKYITNIRSLAHVPTRDLRSSDAPLLVVSRTQTELARRAFSIAAPSIWNSLPADMCENVSTFKPHLKTHLFRLTYSSCAASTSVLSSDLEALYKCVIIIIIIIISRQITGAF